MICSTRSPLPIVVVLAMACSADSKNLGHGSETGAKGPTVSSPDDFASFSAGEVLAHSQNGRYIVAALDDEIKVWTSAGKRRPTSKPLMRRPDTTDTRYAISDDGQFLAHTNRKRLQVISLDAGRKWSIALGAIGTLWGDPVFAPNKTIALPLQGRVSLYNWENGKLAKTIGHTDNLRGSPPDGIRYTPNQGITLARNLYISRDGRHMAITCGTNRATPSNHSVFVADMASGHIVAEMPGHADVIDDVHFLPNNSLVTLDGHGILRWFTLDGLLTATLDAGKTGDTLAVGGEGGHGTVVLGNHLGATSLWNAESSTIARIPSRGRSPVVFIGLSGTTIWVLRRDGESRILSPSEFPRGKKRLLTKIPRSQAKDIQALWRLAKGDFHHAIRRFHSRTEPLYFAAYAFALLREGSNPSKTDEALARAQQDAKLLSGLIELGSLYVNGGYVHHGIALFSGWLKSPLRATRAPTEQDQALRLGLDIVSMLGSFDDGSNSVVAEWLIKTWPFDAAAVRAFADAAMYSAPEDVEKAARALIKHDPTSAEAWSIFVDFLAEEQEDRVPGIVQEALNVLPSDDAARWAFKGSYEFGIAKRYAEAVSAYEKALILDPGNEEYTSMLTFYKERLAQ